MAGVGNATASRALNGAARVSEEARTRILQVARELNYQPNRSAQALKGGRSGMIGMIVPRMSDLFFARCVEAVETVANRNNSLLVVLATHDRSQTTADGVKQLLHHNVDGLVLGISEYLSSGLVRSLRALPVPAVGIDAPLTKADLPSVLIDNCNNAQSATEHLIGHGYERIMSVQVNPKLFTMQERRRGYEAAMQKAGIQLPPPGSFPPGMPPPPGFIPPPPPGFPGLSQAPGQDQLASDAGRRRAPLPSQEESLREEQRRGNYTQRR